MTGLKMVIGGLGFLLGGGILLVQLGAQDSTTIGKARQQGSLQASILLEESGRAAREMATDEMFYSGERFRLKLRSDRDGYVYVVLRDSQGQTQLIYPTKADRVSENWIDRKRPQSIPESDFFRFDENAGTEQMWVIVSSRRLADLDRVSRDGLALDVSALRRHIGKDPDESKGIDRTPGENVGSAEKSVLPLRIIHLPR
jgi:hypothetical protein